LNLLIDGRYRMSVTGLAEREDEEYKDSFLYWIRNHYASVQGHIAGQLKVFKSITGEVSSINEYFGGSGMGTMMLQRIFKPSIHSVWDIDPMCISNLEILKETHEFNSLVVAKGDAESTMLTAEQCDLEVLDFNRFSPSKIRTWQAQFDAVFNRGPKWIYLVDTAQSRVPLLRKAFSDALGYPVVDREDCLRGYSRYFFEHYSYIVEYGAYSNFACMLLRPSETYVEPSLEKISRLDGMGALQTW
jgi:hypothetical protein